MKLPPDIQIAVRDNRLSMGHARALINVENPEQQMYIFHKSLSEDLSVRKVEEIVRGLNEEKNEPVKGSKLKYPKQYQSVKKQLDSIFNSKIDFSMNEKGRGKIVIPFKSATDLERIVKIIENQK